MNGIIIVDKPVGWTSHDVVAKLRGALRIKRVGHGGTLDPMATGVLPVFTSRATRAAQYCENAEKEYIAGLKLGITTDTQDISGNVLRSSEMSRSIEDVHEIIPQFIGRIQQIPPMYSAVKQNGKKLYELARRGIDVPRQARDVCISSIELLGEKDGEFLLKVACSKGTYIRTLCHDIGEAMECGGVMSSLRRTKAGVFVIEQAHTLDMLLESIAKHSIEQLMLPVDSIFSEYPRISLDYEQTGKCKNGASFITGGKQDGKYRFYAPDGEFLMLGEVCGGLVKNIKGFYEPQAQ